MGVVVHAFAGRAGDPRATSVPWVLGVDDFVLCKRKRYRGNGAEALTTRTKTENDGADSWKRSRPGTPECRSADEQDSTYWLGAAILNPEAL